MSNISINVMNSGAIPFPVEDALLQGLAHAMRKVSAYKVARSGAVSTAFTSAPSKGDKIKLSYPSLPAVDVMKDGYAGTAGTVNDTEVELTLDKELTVNRKLTSREATLSMNDPGAFQKKVINPALESLMRQIDAQIMSSAQLVYNTDPQLAIENFEGAEALAKLRPHLANVESEGEARFFIVDRDQYFYGATNSQFANANTGADGANTQRTGRLDKVAGLDFMMSAGVSSIKKPTGDGLTDLVWNNVHTAGNLGNTTAAVNGAVLEGATTVDIDGATPAAPQALKGDRFTVADVSGTYVVTADSAVGAANAVSGIAFSPAAPEGGFPDDAVITFAGSHVRNLVCAPGCLAAATLPPAVASGTQGGTILHNPSGLGFTMLAHPAAEGTNRSSYSFTVLMGHTLFRPALGSVFMSPP